MRFFLLSEVVQIPNTKACLHTQHTQPTGTEFLVTNIWGSKERTFLLYLQVCMDVFFHCRWEAETQSKLEKKNQNSSVPLWVHDGMMWVHDGYTLSPRRLFKGHRMGV